LWLVIDVSEEHTTSIFRAVITHFSNVYGGGSMSNLTQEKIICEIHGHDEGLKLRANMKYVTGKQMALESGCYMKYFTAAGIMRAVVMLLVLQLQYPTAANEPSPTTEDSLVSCVSSIVQRHVSPDRQIMVSSTGEDNGHLDLLLKKINEVTRC
jgi:hypothetical protein